MQTANKIFYKIFLLGAALAVVAPSFASAAFGVSPPFLNATHLVPGVKYVQTIYLVQDRPDEDLPILAKLDISDRVRSWISLDKGYNFIIPKGTRQFPISVTVDVPKDAERLSYNGNLSIASQPSSKGQVTVALGANIAINLNVGNDIYEKYSIPVINFLDIEEGWNPKINVKFNNEGNIAESLSGATFEILDRFGSVRLAYIQKTSGFPETPPFTIGDYTIEFPIDFHLGQGQYWGIATLFDKNSKVVGSQRTVFNVLAPGSIGGTTAKIITYLKINWMYYAIGAAIIIISGFVVWRKKRLT